MNSITYKIPYLAALIILVIILLVGCSSGSTVYVPVPYTPPPTQVPTTVYVPPTTVYIPPTTTAAPIPQPTPITWAWNPSPGNIVSGGNYAYFPGGGAYVQAGKTLTLTWSADGSVDTFIFTANQFNNFKGNLNIATTWMAKGSGPSGSISVVVQNGDSYYGVVRNTVTFGPSVKLYQAELSAR